MISTYWTLSSYPSSTQIFPKTCYSNWKFINDVTSQIVSMASSSVHPGLDVGNTVDGFYSNVNHYLFHSTGEPYPWVRYDFSQLTRISKIIVKGRTSNMLTHFKDVLVQVSTTTITGTFSTVDQCCSTILPAGEFHVFDFTAEPLNVISIKLLRNSASSVILSLADIKFIS